MGILKKKFRDIKKFPGWIYWLPARLMQLYYRFFFRHEWIDPLDLTHTAVGAVTVTWHNRLFFFAVA